MGWLDAAEAFAQNVGNTVVSVATAPFAVAYQAGQQASSFVSSSQPTTTSGQQYVSAPTQQLSSGGVVAPQSYVEQAQAMISPVMPTIQNAIIAAPLLINPITVPIMAGAMAAGTLGIKSPLATERAIATQTMQPIAAQPSLKYLAPLEPNIYSEQALQEVKGRYGYTDPSQLGDLRTQQIEKTYQNAYNTLNMMGVSVATPDTMLGRTIEAQRQGAVDTRSQQFYSGELQKWVQNQVELSSAYHVVGAKAAIPIPANPYEYRGDLAVEFLKGAPTRASEYFSPVSGEMSTVLPKGVGLQQEGWNVAKTGRISTLDYNAAITKLASAGYGPYGALWGGPEYKETGSNAPQSLMAPIKAPFVSTVPVSVNTPTQGDMFLRTERDVEIGGGGFAVKGYAAQPTITSLPEPFISSTIVETKPSFSVFGFDILPALGPVGAAYAFFQPSKLETTRYGAKTELPSITTLGTPEVTTRQVPGGTETITTTPVTTVGGESRQVSTGETQGLSGWDKLQLSASEAIQGILPKGSLEAIRMQEKIYGGIAKESPTPLNLFSASGISEEKTFIEKPLETGASYAIGFGFGALAKGVEAGYMGARAATAETIISKGGMYRAAEQYGATIMGRAPQVLGALYAVDIGARATEGFKSFEPVGVMQRAVPILTFETAPMTAGFMGGAKAVEIAPTIPSKIIETRVLAQPMIEVGIAKAYIGGMNLEAGLMEARVLAKPTAEAAIAEMYMKGQRIGYSIPEIIPYGKSYISESIAGGKQMVSSAKGTIGEGARGVLYDYSRYTGEIAAKNYLTPSQKIDKAILQIQESGTGILTPEKSYVFQKSTGELIYSEWGDIYYKGRWLSSASMDIEAMESAMRAKGIEPITIFQQRGTKIVDSDYSDIVSLHTHPKGTNVRGTGYGYLEVPSEADIIGAYQRRTGIEGAITPKGVVTYTPRLEPKMEVFERSYRRAFAEDYIGSETGVGKTFAESMQRYGSGKSVVYRTTGEIKAGLPEGTTLSPTILGYTQSKIYPAYFEAKLALTTPIDIALGRAEISGKSFVQEFPGRITKIGEVVAGKGEITVPTTIGPLNAPLLPTHGEIVEAMYAPRLSKILAPTTFGERAPMPQLPSTGGERRGGVATTTSPATPGFDRVVKTSKGFGLAKEPSLKSMGQAIGTTTVKEGIPGIARTTDFRGRPTSPTMKPMGEKATGVKQATGVSLLTEQLPVVEGLTTGRTAMREPVSQFYGAPSLQQAQRGEERFVEVIEPSLEFAQTSKTRRESAMAVSPAFMSAGIVAQASRTDTRTSFAQVSEQASRSALGSISATELSRRTSLDLSRSSDYDRISVPRVSTRERVDVVPRIDQIIDTRQTQKTSSITDITTKYIPTIVPPPPIPGFPLLPSFSPTMMGGGSQRRFKKFTEYMSFGGLGWTGKMTAGTNTRRIGKLKARKKK